MIEIKVPTVGESINEVTLVKWLKQDGSYVERDEVIAELESEKATFELNAEQAGVLKTVGKEGDTLAIGDVVAQIDETAAKPEGSAATQVQSSKPTEQKAEPAPAEAKAQPAAANAPVTSIPNDVKATPVASAIIADKKVDPKSIQPSGMNCWIPQVSVPPGASPRPSAVTRFSAHTARDMAANGTVRCGLMPPRKH